MKLTKKRQRWVKNREVVIEGKPLLNSALLEHKYKNALEKLVYAMERETKKEIIKLFEDKSAYQYFETQERMAEDASIASQSRILVNYLTRKYQEMFNKKAKSMSERMIKGALAHSKASLHSSLEKLSGGLSLKTGLIPENLKESIKASIEENVTLIKSIPEEYYKNIAGSVSRSISTGEGLKELVPAIQKHAGVTYRRAKNIALDQTRKAVNTIDRQRMLSLGIKKFKWLHVGGSQRPRQSHIDISGKIFSFENLLEEQAALGVPERDRGLCGYPPYCRCIMNPVIEFDD